MTNPADHGADVRPSEASGVRLSATDELSSLRQHITALELQLSRLKAEVGAELIEFIQGLSDPYTDTWGENEPLVQMIVSRMRELHELVTTDAKLKDPSHEA